MPDPNGKRTLLFPCECVSSREENYSDPWSPISQNKLFRSGTKEDILNVMADEPKTISQIAAALNLSAPSIHTQINELLTNEIIRDSTEWEKLHPKERYYEPNFPVVNAAECAEMERLCGDLSDTIADLIENSRPALEEAFRNTEMHEKGWTLDDLSQCMFARIQRKARRLLEERGVIRPAQPHRNGVSWSFWAEQVESEKHEQ